MTEATELRERLAGTFAPEYGTDLLDTALATARSEGYEYGLLSNKSPEIIAVARASRRAAIKRIRAVLLTILDEEAKR